jgi:hypothetical protein
VPFEIRWDSQPMMQDHDLANTASVTSDAQGKASLDFGPRGGLELGISGNLYYYNSDGQCIEPWWRAMVGGVDPEQFVNDHAQTVYITGKAFEPAPRVFLDGGTTSIEIAPVVRVSPELLRITVPAGTAAGEYDLRVLNADEHIGFLAQGLRITNPAPTVTAIAPDHAYWDEYIGVTVTGTNFVAGASLRLVRGSQVIPAVGVTVASPTRLTGSLMLLGAAPGQYDVVVVNPGPGEPTGALVNGFQVKPRWRVRLPLVLKDKR